MKKLILLSALAGLCGLVSAKLPAPDDAAKAKAAEASAKTAWQGKVDSYLLCKSQDKVAAHYRKTAATAKATAAAPAAPAVTGGTAVAPAAAPTPTPCADPGPFAYNAPDQKPLEASGAHSPAGNATSQGRNNHAPWMYSMPM